MKFWGLPYTCPPNRLWGKQWTAGLISILWGFILYEMTTARRPFAGENLAVIFNAITHDVPRRPRTADGPLPPALADLIMKSLGQSTGRTLSERGGHGQRAWGLSEK